MQRCRSIKNEGYTASQAVAHDWLNMLVGILALLIVFPLAGLVFLHLRLIRSNKTTNEFVCVALSG
jgi:predicted Na+-dependent transporter